jgi:hypothetical protein
VPEPPLFDVEADPGETRNLAGERPELVAALGGALDRWVDSVSADEGFELPEPEDDALRARLRSLGYSE